MAIANPADFNRALQPSEVSIPVRGRPGAIRSGWRDDTKPAAGRSRVVIEDVAPQVEGGRYAVRRIVGDEVTVSAAIYADGHDLLDARLLYRHKSERFWRYKPMRASVNDLWSGSFSVDRLGSWSFAVLGWVDHFLTWSSDLRKRIVAQAAPVSVLPNAPESDQRGANIGGQDIPLALRSGAILVQQAARRARGVDAKRLSDTALLLERLAARNASFYDYPLSEDVEALVSHYPDVSSATYFESAVPVRVDRERARFSAWYEMFPRSASPVPGRHGTLTDVERQLPEIAAMGFDVLYLPPIHPIGRAYRKGPENTPPPEPGVAPPEWPGSPWAIGDRSVAAHPTSNSRKTEDDGGHKSIHPQLGTIADFDRLAIGTREQGMEIALDIAFQCSPDHPWVVEHPTWFVMRPDGSIQYAENPPKKYQDIYPLNFESNDWRDLWNELYSVFEFWIRHGVHIFRVDNPHTKALPFWEWCIGKLLNKYPDSIFLAEAFTRPHVMYGLAKIGFTQSYTYFTWRNTKPELQAYLEEITRPPVSDFFQPNFWPNTPDILHKALQEGGRPAFILRLILAATLAANYGIYGPAFELCENTPAKAALGKMESEEYLHSEKYEIRQRDRNAPGTLVPLITLVNRIRRDNPALHSNGSLTFHSIDNPNLVCYSKSTPDFENTILAVVNLDPFHEQTGWTDLDLAKLGLVAHQSFVVEDLLTGSQYTWLDRWNYAALRPWEMPAHVFRIVRRP